MERPVGGRGEVVTAGMRACVESGVLVEAVARVSSKSGEGFGTCWTKIVCCCVSGWNKPPPSILGTVAVVA